MQFDTSASAHLKGRVMWAVINDDGSTARHGTLEPVAPSNNLVLDQGLDLLDTNELAVCFENCAVGSGSSTPVATQIELDNEHARTNNYVTDLCGTNIPADYSDPYVVTMKRGFDFPKGSLDSSVDGDYAEIGFSPAATAGQNLFSRALIKDEADNAITVSVASDQILRIAYELDVGFSPASATAGSVSITNIGTINYSALIESAARFSSSTISSEVMEDGRTTSSDVGLIEPSIFPGIGTACGVSSLSSALDGIVRDQTVDISSGLELTDTLSITYNGSGVWEYSCTFSTSQGNVTGIRSIILGKFVSYAMVRFLIDSADAFDKANTHELTFNFQLTYTAN